MKHFNDILKVCGKEDLSLAQFLSNAVLLDSNERVVDVDRVRPMLCRVRARLVYPVDGILDTCLNELWQELGL